jgi:hypothetical protein
MLAFKLGLVLATVLLAAVVTVGTAVYIDHIDPKAEFLHFEAKPWVLPEYDKARARRPATLPAPKEHGDGPA